MDRPAGKSIYTGLKLSEQADASTAPPRTNQRLFAPARTSPAPEFPSIAPGDPPAPARQASLDVVPDPAGASETPVATVPPSAPVAQRRPPASRRPAASERLPAPSFDLSDLPYRKDTFLFTPEEFEALDDLKLSLRRTLDVKVTKNDLVRCAVQYLVEDVHRLGDASPVIAPFKKRSGR